MSFVITLNLKAITNHRIKNKKKKDFERNIGENLFIININNNDNIFSFMNSIYLKKKTPVLITI